MRAETERPKLCPNGRTGAAGRMTEADFFSALSGIRLLALDLDGTLLTDDKRLTPRCAGAVRAAVDAGLIPVAVTGRPLSGIPEEVAALPGLRYAICSNGAVTVDLHSGERLRAALLDPAAALEIVQLPIERGLIHSVFVDGVGYCEPQFFAQQWAFFRDKPIAAYVKKSRRPVEDLRACILGSGGVENVWFIARSTAERNELDALIRGGFRVQTSLTAALDVEVGDPAADKGLAILALARSLGLEREQILAIGDNGNDLGLLRAAGLAVATGNATADVLAAADYVTDSNESDGAAKVIEALLAAGSRRDKLTTGGKA